MAIDSKDTRFIVEFLRAAYAHLKEVEIRRLQREIPPALHSQLVRAAASWRAETDYKASEAAKHLLNGIDLPIFQEVGELAQYTSTELTEVTKKAKGRKRKD